MPDVTITPADSARPKTIRVGLEPWKREVVSDARSAELAHLMELVRAHRLNPEPPEKKMIEALDRRAARYEFQHLFPTLGRTCDFLIEDARLVIEIDGPEHRRPSEARNQARWEREVREITGGYRIFHITNEQALRANLDEWLEALGVKRS